MADPIVTACLIRPDLITSYVVTNVEAVPDGKAKGSILVDYAKTTNELENTKIIQSIDVDSYKTLLIHYLTRG